MRKAITRGFDCQETDDVDDIILKFATALKSFGVEVFVTYSYGGDDGEETISVDLYKFLDETNVTVAIKPPQFDEARLEKIFLEYLANNTGNGNESK